MDRFVWGSGNSLPGEQQICSKGRGARLYDGDQKTVFGNGDVVVTSHRLIWSNPAEASREFCLHLSLIVFAEEEQSGWVRAPKIVLHLNPLPSQLQTVPRPVEHSPFQHIKLSLKEGEREIFHSLLKALEDKKWESIEPGGKWKSGIGGIERQLQAKHQATHKNISAAFEDLGKLMGMAKTMVELSRSISQKIREKKGEITEDETIQFKSHLLSLGISDPVTKNMYSTENVYYQELAKQIAQIMSTPVREAGGILALPEVYCRINRARGFELLSPDDLLNACKLMEPLKLDVHLRTFDSGVMALQLATHNDKIMARETLEIVQANVSLSAEELAKIVGISVILAKERLLSAEKQGLTCRDDNVEGLRFYPNKFLETVID